MIGGTCIGLALLLIAGGGGAAAILPEGATFEVLTEAVDFAEGPAAAPDGKIYFSDIPTGPKKGRILVFDPRTKAVSVFASDSHKSNGLYFDRRGRLVACEGADFGGRKVARYDLGGDSEPESLTEKFQGGRFSAPNDLCVDERDRVWFTDPKYLGEEPRELDHRSVYRLDPDGSLHRVLTQPEIEKPNGIHLSPDGRTLYVADTNNEPVALEGGGTRPGKQQLVAFDLRPDGTPANKRVLVDFAPGSGCDGMTVDVDGNIYAAIRDKERPGIRVYSPDGKEIALVPTLVVPTNCVFGRGAEANVLYVTTDKSFGRIRLNAMGYHLSPAN